MPQLLRDHTRASHSVCGDDWVHAVDASTDKFALAQTATGRPVKQAHDAQAAKWPHPHQALVTDAMTRKPISDGPAPASRHAAVHLVQAVRILIQALGLSAFAQARYSETVLAAR